MIRCTLQKEKKGGRTELRVSMCGSARDHHSRQARNYIFLTRMFPAALNHPLSQRHPESSISYNHICGGPRQEHRPPENPEERGSKQLQMPGEGWRRGSDWFGGVSSRTERAGGVLVPSLNTCLPQREGWEAEGGNTGEKWITSRVP